MDLSAKGTRFLTQLEGEVLKAYRDSAGVWTIGVGLTAASGVIKPKAGMTITHEESQRLLRAALSRNYVPAVQKLLPVANQNEFDGAVSVVYNCGTGATKWKWAQALAKGDVKEAARLLRTTAVTAGGKRLKGLVNRREKEARLIEAGIYGIGAGPNAKPSPAISPDVLEKLRKLGYDSIEKYQAAKGLKVDGIAGPATRSTIQRDIDGQRAASTTTKTGTAGGIAGGGYDASTAHSVDWASVATTSLLVALAAVILVGGAYLVYRYRGPLFYWLPSRVKDFFQFKLGITVGRRVIDV